MGLAPFQPNLWKLLLALPGYRIHEYEDFNCRAGQSGNGKTLISEPGAIQMVSGKELYNRSLALDSPGGLTSDEARHRRAKYGRNSVAEEKPHLIRALLRKFWSPVPWMREATIALEVALG